MVTPLKKNPLSALGADNGFFDFNLLAKVRPLSTPLLVADANYAGDEYQNKANKVANGDDFIHSVWWVCNLCYRVAGWFMVVKPFYRFFLKPHSFFKQAKKAPCFFDFFSTRILAPHCGHSSATGLSQVAKSHFGNRLHP